MKGKIVFLWIFFCLISGVELKAQIWLEHQAIYDEAEWYLEGHEYEEAIPLYQLLEKKGVSNAHLSYKTGVCFLGLEGKKQKSISYLEAAVLNSTSNFNNHFAETRAPLEAYLKLGIAYRISDRYDESIKAFEIYKDSIQDDQQITLANYYIKQVENARFFHNQTSKFTLEEIKDNSSYSVFNPVVFSDSLVFYTEARPFYDAIVSGAIKQGILIERENLTPKIGSEDELVLVCVSPIDNTIVLRGYDPENGYELYFSKYVEGEYTSYEPFPAPINSPSNERFASFSFDGKTMFFTSNRPGGYGGGDIYVSSLLNDTNWSEPVNIGNVVNTQFDEEVCYLSHDGSTLYFSSQGHINMGGHDLFYAKKGNENKWAAPVNFGAPISTTDDDLFISSALNGELYTSRYSIDLHGKKILYKIPVVSNALAHSILVKSQLSFTEELPAKEVPYILSDASTGEPILRSATSENRSSTNQLESGAYMFKYVYNEQVYAEQIVNITPDIGLSEISLSPPEWQIITINDEIAAEVVIVINDILFAFNRYEVDEVYKPMLDTIVKLLNEGVLSKVIIEGHTDRLGSVEYNMLLANKRANAVGEYLSAQGIAQDQYIISGFGEEQPVAVEVNEDGTDNIEGRKYNRRVTLRVEANGQDIVVRQTRHVPDQLKLQP